MNKVVLVKDPRIEETFPQEWPARVTIELETASATKSSFAIPRAIPKTRSLGTKWLRSSDALAGRVLHRALRRDHRRDLKRQAGHLPALCN